MNKNQQPSLAEGRRRGGTEALCIADLGIVRTAQEQCLPEAAHHRAAAACEPGQPI